ncbi:hypothetical protein [Mycobacterium helveticum]|uniref:Hcy-binding domain-containing protein n=1 Tax=Mycobacterium helveticum TaxID=2592811 RepID=A0A557XW74_9MYCO|nr:hypothetical protein [Mycobacterium helveticum]TVS87904.1 hypothetical protein FPZ46_07135 [Mycobacterium helveticum]TVS90285.1 hypothetical protein FPZ47_10075 [Mycobacterium helveticum]
MIAGNTPRHATDTLDALAQPVVVGDGAMGTRLQAADPSLDGFDIRRRRGRDEIRSAAIWLKLTTTTFADKVRKPALKGTAIAERVGSSWASRRRVTT